MERRADLGAGECQLEAGTRALGQENMAQRRGAAAREGWEGRGNMHV